MRGRYNRWGFVVLDARSHWFRVRTRACLQHLLKGFSGYPLPRGVGSSRCDWGTLVARLPCKSV